jgi:hypothetical protein
MEKITIEGVEYYSWERFLKISGLKNRKSIYDWVKDGKAEIKKIGSASFFRETR